MMLLEEAKQTLLRMEKESESKDGDVFFNCDGHRGELVLSNPARKNAMSIRMMRQLAGVVLSLRETELHLICVRGDGGTFCSGGALNEVRRYLEYSNHGLVMSQAMTTVLDGLGALPILTCAWIDGYAVGGGAEIAVSCDVRLMHADAVLHFVHRKLGVVPGWGATRRLVRLLGATKALDMLVRAERLNAQKCMSLGLVQEVSKLDCSDAMDQYFTSRLGTATLLALKEQMTAATAQQRDGLESRAFGKVWGGSQHKAALEQVFSPRDKS